MYKVFFLFDTAGSSYKIFLVYCKRPLKENNAWILLIFVLIEWGLIDSYGKRYGMPG